MYIYLLIEELCNDINIFNCFWAFLEIISYSPMLTACS